MNEDVVASTHAIDDPALVLEDPNQFLWFYGRELAAHVARTTTRPRSLGATDQPRSRMVSR